MIGRVATQTFSAEGKDLNEAHKFSSPTLVDIETHSKIGANAAYVENGPATWTHEGLHGVDNEIQLSNMCYGAQFYCAFYLGDSLYAKVPLPTSVTRADCVAGIPQRARIGRFDFYFNFVNSHEAHRTPGYVLEEWNAYIFGASAGFEVYEAGLWPTSALENLFQGPSEFAIFYSGCIAAFAEKEPAYLAATNVKEFLAHQFERTFSLYYRSRKYASRFPGVEDEQFAAFVNDADGASARAAVKALFGDAFWNRVVLNSGVNVTTEPSASTTGGATATAPGTAAPTITNPDQAWNKALFDASKLSWNALELKNVSGPAGGGGGKPLGAIPKPTLAPVMWSADDCFFAVARNNGIQLSDVSCDRPVTDVGELGVGEPVVVQGSSRIWEDQCGTCKSKRFA